MLITEVTHISPHEIQRILGSVPETARDLRIEQQYVKDLQDACSPIASHPRYHISTFLDVKVS